MHAILCMCPTFQLKETNQNQFDNFLNLHWHPYTITHEHLSFQNIFKAQTGYATTDFIQGVNSSDLIM